MSIWDMLFWAVMAGIAVFAVVITVFGLMYEAEHGTEEHWSSKLQRQSREKSHRAGSSVRSRSGSGSGSSSKHSDYDFGAGLD